jgi:hypothetical protein
MQRKGAKVLTQFYLGLSRDEIAYKLHANSATFPSLVSTSDKRLKFDDSEGIHFWEEVGRRSSVPVVLRGIRIDQVVLRQKTTLDERAVCFKPGSHTSQGAEAYVEHSVPPAQNPTFGNVQHITIVGDTLDAANSLLDSLPTVPTHDRVAKKLRLVLNVVREIHGTDVPLYRAITDLCDELGFTETSLYAS